MASIGNQQNYASALPPGNVTPNFQQPSSVTPTTSNWQSSANVSDLKASTGNVVSDFKTTPRGLSNRKTFEPEFEVREREPIVHQKIVPTEKVQVQPIIYRERQMEEYHEVIQPMKETQIEPEQIRHVSLPAEHRPEFYHPDTEYKQIREEYNSRMVPQTITAEVQREVVEKPPIVKEIIRKKVIEEIQPILYKEIIRPVIIQETRNVLQREVLAPVVTQQTRTMVNLSAPSSSVGQHFHHVHAMAPFGSYAAEVPRVPVAQQSNIPERVVAPVASLNVRHSAPTLSQNAVVNGLPPRQSIPVASLSAFQQSVAPLSNPITSSVPLNSSTGLQNLPTTQAAVISPSVSLPAQSSTGKFGQESPPRNAAGGTIVKEVTREGVERWLDEPSRISQ
jgi:hypothetical protein